MIGVVIFGTGSSAERAWATIEENEGVEVVAFADNNVQKQGVEFHGRLVWNPDRLSTREGWTYVLVASEWDREITEQLVAQGILRSLIFTFAQEKGAGLLKSLIDKAKPGAWARVGERLVQGAAFPKVLLLSHETLNSSHGTGVLLQRYFDDFPKDHLMSVAHRDAGAPWLERASVMASSDRDALQKLRYELGEFKPDLIYATALSESDLDLLETVVEVLPSRVPVVQHFMDLIPHDEDDFFQRLKHLAPLLTEVWALTEPMQHRVSSKLGREVRLVTGLLQHVPEFARIQHMDFSPRFRTMMIGNFYNASVIPFMREAWASCRRKLADLGPVEWFVSPSRMQDLFDQGIDPGLDFVWRGFFKGKRLQRRLAEADLAILPLNHELYAKNDYLRYSLPSRLAEYACVGVPVLAIASEDTPLAAFVRDRCIGLVVSSHSVTEAADQMISFILDREAREEAGVASRILAESEFQIDTFRSWLNSRIFEIVESGSLSKS